MDQKYITLFDEYTHAPLPRREFIDRLTKLAGSTAAAMALLPILENNYAQAAIISPDDERITASSVEFKRDDVALRAYQAQPAGGANLPAVIVIHENRGLNPHIEDVARRLAVAGFLAVAVDALSPLGGTPEDTDKARSMIRDLDRDDNLKNYLAAIEYTKNHKNSNGNVGCVGFCWGGAMANNLAVHSPDLKAAVAYYGRQAAAEDAPKIKASLLLHYAELDERINRGIPEYQKALDAAKVDYTLHIYKGVNHAFNNDTNQARYDKQAADLAWDRTVVFLGEKLKK